LTYQLGALQQIMYFQDLLLPNKYALTQTLLRRSRLVGAESCDSHLILTFITPMGFWTRRLAYVLDSLVRVTRRVSRSIFDKIALHPQANLRLSDEAPMKGLHRQLFSQINLILPFTMKKSQTTVTIAPASRLSTKRILSRLSHNKLHNNAFLLPLPFQRFQVF